MDNLCGCVFTHWQPESSFRRKPTSSWSSIDKRHQYDGISRRRPDQLRISRFLPQISFLGSSSCRFLLTPLLLSLIRVSRRTRETVPRQIIFFWWNPTQMIAVEAVTRLRLKWGPSGIVFVSPLSFCKRDIEEWVGDQILWQRNGHIFNATSIFF